MQNCEALSGRALCTGAGGHLRTPWPNRYSTVRFDWIGTPAAGIRVAGRADPFRGRSQRLSGNPFLSVLTNHYTPGDEPSQAPVSTSAFCLCAYAHCPLISDAWPLLEASGFLSGLWSSVFCLPPGSGLSTSGHRLGLLASGDRRDQLRAACPRLPGTASAYIVVSVAAGVCLCAVAFGDETASVRLAFTRQGRSAAGCTSTPTQLSRTRLLRAGMLWEGCPAESAPAPNSGRISPLGGERPGSPSSLLPGTVRTSTRTSRASSSVRATARSTA